MRSRVFTVRPVQEADWPRLKALRLEMLADTPIAYLETLATARSHPDSHWIGRARPRSGRLQLVAEAADARFVGTMGGVVQGGSPALVAVYVAPAWRGAAGVTDALLEGVEAWARDRGAVLRLEVNELNDRARAAYERRGFVLTGRSLPYPLDPPSLELEMVKRLR